MNSSLAKSRDEFQRARRRAALQSTLAAITGRKLDLLPYDEIRTQLKFSGSSPSKRIEIPIAAIVGSVARYNDFTRSFLPASDVDEMRWASVRAYLESAPFPPIEVYQVGDAYFVIDGNHRVSIARSQGLTYIPAIVTEIKTRVPLSQTDTQENILCKSRYADFLQQTNLDLLRPGCDLYMNLCEKYDLLLGQIEVNRFLIWKKSGIEPDYPTVVTDWYDNAYMPVVNVIRDQDLVGIFHEWTEADLYVLLSEHGLELKKQLGEHVPPDETARHFFQNKNHVSSLSMIAARLKEMFRRFR